MTYADASQHIPAHDTAKRASSDRGGFFATLFSALRAGTAVRSGRRPATATEPLRFHGNPRVF